ncbi:TPA: hypothetical protein QCN85_005754 [Bacillus anthracis]|nr:hypothetical protein [Bacillus anthracis]
MILFAVILLVVIAPALIASAVIAFVAITSAVMILPLRCAVLIDLLAILVLVIAPSTIIFALTLILSENRLIAF